MARRVPQAVDTVGEILLSLSYLPTAERLTVVVVKAKNLVWTNGKVTAGEQGVPGGHRGPSVFCQLEVGSPALSYCATWIFIGVAPLRTDPTMRVPQRVVSSIFSISQGKHMTDPGVFLSPHPEQIPSSRCTCCRTGGRSARRRQR